LSLKHKTISGVKWTTLSSAVNAILQLLQLMILARYLIPSEFGLVAILMVIINIAQVFVDFGLSNSIIHKNNVTQTQLSTLYWLNILLSIIIFGIIFLSSSYIAEFYNQPKLGFLIVIISYSLIIQAFGQQFRTLFQKELQFNILARIDIFANIISFLSAVILAIKGFGIYALIYPVLIMAVIKSVLLIHKGLDYHKPKLIFRLNEIKGFLSFGFYTVANGTVSMIAAQADVILIGKLLGVETLGMYSVAKELILRPAQLINPIITKVAFPVMSKVNTDIMKIKNIYLRLINYIASVNFPIYIVTIILAQEIITLFLGEKWITIAQIFQILAIWALIRSIGNPIGSLVMAMGKPQYEMVWNIGMLFFMPIVVYISSSWGIKGIAIGNVIAMIILFIPMWYFLVYKLCGASLKEYIFSVLSPLLISLFIGTVIYLVLNIYEYSLIYKFFVTITVLTVFLWILYKKYNQDFYSIFLSLLVKSNKNEN